VDRFVKYSNTLAVEVIERDNSSTGIPIVTDVVLSQRGLDIKKYIEKNGSELQSIDPHKLFEGAEFAVEMFKDSMSPDIMAGDKVILQFLPKDAKLQSGAMYFINSIPYADVVRDVFIDGDIATLKARNKRYGDIVLNIKTDILRVANVLGVYRNTFNSSYAQLDELRRTKEEQLNRFIDMQSEMVAEIREQGKRNDKERERVDRLIEKIINQ
jgi:SOS-response transcriptional repressor LexA